DARRLKYLRKISPYVFEELLLLAFEQQGMPVIRNPSYSGDGGLDGQVVINGERWLIQAKRYGRTIRPAHIDAFGELLRRKGCRGFFIHTGRTGNISRARLTLWPDIELISGQRLLQLLNGTLLSIKEDHDYDTVPVCYAAAPASDCLAVNAGRMSGNAVCLEQSEWW
ncbi:TPA: restriction endonuclease, partial [Escherichia coli]